MAIMRTATSRLLWYLALIVYAHPGGFLFGQGGNLRTPESYGKKIEVSTDVLFGGESALRFDYYRPAKSGPTPIVICWFGGAFWGSSKSQMAGIGAFLAAHGLAAMAPDYTLGEKDGAKGSWPLCVHDAKAAVRFVRANAGLLGVEPDRIAALGYSSGAYLAMMVGFTPNLTELEGGGSYLNESSKVSAVVDISGVCDRRRAIGLPLALLGKEYEEKQDLRVAASPIIYVHAKTVPVYILHGTRDSVVDVSSATQLAAALNDAKVKHEIRLVDADHAPITIGELQRITDWLLNVLSSPSDSVGNR